MIIALLAIASIPSFSVAPVSVEDLPLDEWIERADDLTPVAFRYRMVNSEGETGTIDVAVESPERATLRYVADDLTVWFTIRDGVGSQIVQAADGSPIATTIDFNEVHAGPLAWLTQTLESLDLPQHSMAAPRMQMSIWPAAEGEGTWSLNMSCGVSDEPYLMWLAKLGDAEFEAERVDDTYVVRLASGAELTLDAASGFLRRGVIDPEDEAAGSVELLHLDLDPDMDVEPFGYEIPDDAQVESDDAKLESSAQLMWDLHRMRVIGLVVKAESEEPDWLEEHREIVVERFGALHTTRHAARVDSIVERLNTGIDRMVDGLAAWYEENRQSGGIAKRLEASKRQIREQLTLECERGGDAMATALVVAPPGFEDSALDAFLEVEHEAASSALKAALLDPSLAHANERLDEVNDGPLRQ